MAAGLWLRLGADGQLLLHFPSLTIPPLFFFTPSSPTQSSQPFTFLSHPMSLPQPSDPDLALSCGGGSADTYGSCFPTILTWLHASPRSRLCLAQGLFLPNPSRSASIHKRKLDADIWIHLQMVVPLLARFVLCTNHSVFVLVSIQSFMFGLGLLAGRSHFRHSLPVLRVSNRMLLSTFLGNSRPLHPDLVLHRLVMQTLWLLSLGWDNLALHSLGRPVLEAPLPEVSKFGHSGVSSSAAGLTEGDGPIDACHCRLPCLRIVLSLHRNMPDCGSLLGFFLFLFFV
ncbi:TMV resistance protein N-like [Pyrus ussuriensis x Pyrus communis]|uniref:TMV resistance protein N-like n=1 Tax=Pyrus ussuriensis x Pyrus communis TaxID=2448454 RepID=A0A5N5I4Q6_9ROSA|nr:TMV resistance protein N-like [Pyrus ussuriensis x Pyrus communis]